MLRRTILRLAHPVALQDLLDSLVTCTGSHRGPHRTPAPTLVPVAADASMLPVWIPPACREAGIVYSTPPSCAQPTGEPILWIQLRPVLRRGRACDGKYRGEVHVIVWQDMRYPLEKREVNWCIADFCGCHRHSWWSLTRGWQKLHDANLQDAPAAGLRLRLVLPKEPPAPRIRRRGTPRLSRRLISRVIPRVIPRAGRRRSSRPPTRRRANAAAATAAAAKRASSTRSG